VVFFRHNAFFVAEDDVLGGDCVGGPGTVAASRGDAIPKKSLNSHFSSHSGYTGLYETLTKSFQLFVAAFHAAKGRSPSVIVKYFTPRQRRGGNLYS
jgi:hypothetical protein